MALIPGPNSSEGLAIFGLIIPNGVFLYSSLVAPTALHSALSNPVVLVFITEAFLLLFLFAWVIRHLGCRSPGWLAFIVMSSAWNSPVAMRRAAGEILVQ